MPANLRNKLRRISGWVRSACLLLLLIFATGCDRFSAETATKTGHTGHETEPIAASGQTYTCPMHPDVVSDKPGECPICHMDLEPLDKVLEQLTADPNRVVVSAQATVKPMRKTLAAPVTVEGIITADERRSNVVSAYVSGRIEELFVKYENTFVKKGQPILTIYSPELVTAQEEYIFVLNAGDEELAALARKKLRLLGLTEAQLNTLTRTRKPQLKITVFSPYAGYINFPETAVAAGMNAVPSATSQSSGMSGMGGAGATSAASTAGAAPVQTDGTALRQGQYVTQGQPLFEVNDLSQVWAVLSVPAGEVTGLTEGSTVTIRSAALPGQELTGKVDFLEPVLREGQRLATARVYLPNTEGKLKPNMLVQAVVTSSGAEESKPLLVPSSAVWQLGRRSIVWVRGAPAGGNSFLFEAREVTIGAQRGGYTEIKAGLPEKALIAKEAGFMIDSESFVRPEE